MDHQAYRVHQSKQERFAKDSDDYFQYLYDEPISGNDERRHFRPMTNYEQLFKKKGKIVHLHDGF